MNILIQILAAFLSLFPTFNRSVRKAEPTRTSRVTKDIPAHVPIRRCDRVCVNTNGHWLKASLRAR